MRILGLAIANAAAVSSVLALSPAHAQPAPAEPTPNPAAPAEPTPNPAAPAAPAQPPPVAPAQDPAAAPIAPEPPPSPAASAKPRPEPVSIAPALPQPPKDPVLLDLGLHAGGAIRFGEPQSYEARERAGLNFGLSVSIAPTPKWAIGLGFEHTHLGRDVSGVSANGTVDVQRDLNALWATLRLNLFRPDPTTIYLFFGPGLAWQSETAQGLGSPGFYQPLKNFKCSATASATFGLRAGVGTDVDLGSSLRLRGEMVMEGDPLTSDSFGDCVAGPGSIGLVAFRVGLTYGIDVTRYVR